MRNIDIAKIARCTEETVSRIINGTYKGDTGLTNWVLFLHNYKGDYLDILFKTPVFSSMCELVIEKASGKNSDVIVKFASICLMRYEELNSEIADADRLTNIEPLHVLKLMGFEPTSILDLFLDELFEQMCLMAIKKCSTRNSTHQQIRIFASLCFEASHNYRVKMGKCETKLHGNRNKKRKPEPAEI